MDITINDQKKNVKVLPTQKEQEVIILQKKEDKQVADKNKRIDKILVEGLVKKSNRILISVSTHKFPFDIFPDTINIEEGRITVITRNFFLSSQIHSVDIKDISNVFINIAPFFAQLIIVSKTFAMNEIRIRNLRKNEAVMARRIIEGLRIFENKHIDTSLYSRDELIIKLEALSTIEIVT